LWYVFFYGLNEADLLPLCRMVDAFVGRP
jgi:hypothetical protein